MHGIRLGELLVRDGAITISQLEAGLEAQRRCGERLGTCLAQLGHLGVDDLARALSVQQNVPPVLAQHIVAIEPRVIALLGARVATTLHAIPLGTTPGVGLAFGSDDPGRFAKGFASLTPGRPSRLVVALRDPHTTPIEEIAFAAGMRIERMIAPEARIRECLARYYGVKVETTLGGAAAPWAELDLEAKPVPDPFAEAEAWSHERPTRRRAQPTLEAPSADAPPPPSQRATSPPPRPYASLVGSVPVDGLAGDDDVDHGWDAIVGDPEREPEAPPSATAPPEALHPFRDVEATITALRTATSRDEVADMLVTWLQSAYGCGLVLMVKNGRAIGWKGYAPDAQQHEIEWIGIPLAPTSLLRQAYEGKVTYRGAPPPEGAALHERMWQLLRCSAPSEVIVGPILLSGRVVNLLYAHPEGSQSFLPSAVEDMSRVASAAATQYAKLIRTKGR